MATFIVASLSNDPQYGQILQFCSSHAMKNVCFVSEVAFGESLDRLRKSAAPHSLSPAPTPPLQPSRVDTGCDPIDELVVNPELLQEEWEDEEQERDTQEGSLWPECCVLSSSEPLLAFDVMAVFASRRNVNEMEDDSTRFAPPTDHDLLFPKTEKETPRSVRKPRASSSATTPTTPDSSASSRLYSSTLVNAETFDGVHPAPDSLTKDNLCQTSAAAVSSSRKRGRECVDEPVTSTRAPASSDEAEARTCKLCRTVIRDASARALLSHSLIHGTEKRSRFRCDGCELTVHRIDAMRKHQRKSKSCRSYQDAIETEPVFQRAALSVFTKCFPLATLPACLEGGEEEGGVESMDSRGEVDEQEQRTCKKCGFCSTSLQPRGLQQHSVGHLSEDVKKRFRCDCGFLTHSIRGAVKHGGGVCFGDGKCVDRIDEDEVAAPLIAMYRVCFPHAPLPNYLQDQEDGRRDTPTRSAVIGDERKKEAKKQEKEPPSKSPVTRSSMPSASDIVVEKMESEESAAKRAKPDLTVTADQEKEKNKCKLCGYSVDRGGPRTFEQHFLEHLPETVNKRFLCNCGFHTHRQASLVRHQRTCNETATDRLEGNEKMRLTLRDVYTKCYPEADLPLYLKEQEQEEEKEGMKVEQQEEMGEEEEKEKREERKEKEERSREVEQQQEREEEERPQLGKEEIEARRECVEEEKRKDAEMEEAIWRECLKEEEKKLMEEQKQEQVRMRLEPFRVAVVRDPTSLACAACGFRTHRPSPSLYHRHSITHLPRETRKRFRCGCGLETHDIVTTRSHSCGLGWRDRFPYDQRMRSSLLSTYARCYPGASFPLILMRRPAPQPVPVVLQLQPRQPMPIPQPPPRRAPPRILATVGRVGPHYFVTKMKEREVLTLSDEMEEKDEDVSTPVSNQEILFLNDDKKEVMEMEEHKEKNDEEILSVNEEGEWLEEIDGELTSTVDDEGEEKEWEDEPTCSTQPVTEKHKSGEPVKCQMCSKQVRVSTYGTPNFVRLYEHSTRHLPAASDRKRFRCACGFQAYTAAYVRHHANKCPQDIVDRISDVEVHDTAIDMYRRCFPGMQLPNFLHRWYIGLGGARAEEPVRIKRRIKGGKDKQRALEKQKKREEKEERAEKARKAMQQQGPPKTRYFCEMCSREMGCSCNSDALNHALAHLPEDAPKRFYCGCGWQAHKPSADHGLSCHGIINDRLRTDPELRNVARRVLSACFPLVSPPAGVWGRRTKFVLAHSKEDPGESGGVGEEEEKKKGQGGLVDGMECDEAAPKTREGAGQPVRGAEAGEVGKPIHVSQNEKKGKKKKMQSGHASYQPELLKTDSSQYGKLVRCQVCCVEKPPLDSALRRANLGLCGAPNWTGVYQHITQHIGQADPRAPRRFECACGYETHLMATLRAHSQSCREESVDWIDKTEVHTALLETHRRCFPTLHPPSALRPYADGTRQNKREEQKEPEAFRVKRTCQRKEPEAFRTTRTCEVCFLHVPNWRDEGASEWETRLMDHAVTHMDNEVPRRLYCLCGWEGNEPCEEHSTKCSGIVNDRIRTNRTVNTEALRIYKRCFPFSDVPHVLSVTNESPSKSDAQRDA